MLGFRHNATVPQDELAAIARDFLKLDNGLTFTGLLTPADAQVHASTFRAPAISLRAFTPVLRSNSVKFESHNLRSNNAELTENTVLHAAIAPASTSPNNCGQIAGSMSNTVKRDSWRDGSAVVARERDCADRRRRTLSLGPYRSGA